MAEQKKETIHGLGRRKTSIARVHLRPGTGKFIINGIEKDKYLKTTELQAAVLGPLKVTGNVTKFDVLVNVQGGGFKGQAGAIILGISRTLIAKDETVGPKLKEYGYLTRDSRMKERKKYGMHSARRATQFSKR